jgi:hypothetical protein
VCITDVIAKGLVLGLLCVVQSRLELRIVHIKPNRTESHVKCILHYYE